MNSRSLCRSAMAGLSVVLVIACGPSPESAAPSDGVTSESGETAAEATGPIDSQTLDRYFVVMEAWREKTKETGNESTDLRNWQEAMGAGEFYRTTLESNGFTDASFAAVNQRVMEAITVLRMRGQVDFDAMERAMEQSSAGMTEEQRNEMRKSFAESRARMREMESADPGLVEELGKRKEQVDRLFGS